MKNRRHSGSSLTAATIANVAGVLLLGLGIAKAGGEPGCYCAYWRPDNVSYAGAVHVYWKNEGQTPLRITGMDLDGKSIGPLVTDEVVTAPLEFRNNYLASHNTNVMWYRVWPNPIPARGLTEIIIRPTAHPGAALTVGIHAEAQPVAKVVVQPRGLPCRISFVGVGADRRKLFIYVRKEPGAPLDLAGVELDGKAATAELLPEKFFLETALLVVKVTEPFAEGSFHTIRVETRQGISTAAMIRVAQPRFPIGGITNFNDFYAKFFDPLSIDTYVGFWGLERSSTLESLKRHGMQGIIGHRLVLDPSDLKNPWKNPHMADAAIVRQTRDDPTLIGYFLTPDEPDGLSNWKKSARDAARAEEFCRRLAPAKPYTLITLDHSGTPKNYYAFGEIAYTTTTHGYGAPGPALRKRTRYECHHGCMATYPRPAYYVPGCHKFAGRGAEETRLELYYALAEGIKGFIYWPLHAVALEKTYGDYTRYREGLAKLHAELKSVGPLLARSDVVPWVLSEPDTMDVATLLAGDEALLVTVVNNAYRSEPPAPFTFTPATNVTVRIALPSWFVPSDGFIVTPDGPQRPLDWKPARGSVGLHFPKIDLTQLVCLTRKTK